MSDVVRSGADRPVEWREAGVVVAVCWAVTAGGYALFALLNQPQLHMAALVGLGLLQWFLRRHRHWRTALTACLVAVPVLFLLIDVLRRHLNHYVADATTTGAAVLVGMVVFTGLSRARGRRS